MKSCDFRGSESHVTGCGCGSEVDGAWLLDVASSSRWLEELALKLLELLRKEFGLSGGSWGGLPDVVRLIVCECDVNGLDIGKTDDKGKLGTIRYHNMY